MAKCCRLSAPYVASTSLVGLVIHEQGFCQYAGDHKSRNIHFYFPFEEIISGSGRRVDDTINYLHLLLYVDIGDGNGISGEIDTATCSADALSSDYYHILPEMSFIGLRIPQSL